MKTICIETKCDAAIGGGIRLLNKEKLIYTTLQQNHGDDIIRALNLKRFGIEVISLDTQDMEHLLDDSDVNFQVVSNDGSSGISHLYPSPKNHPILSKSGLVELASSYPQLEKYIPKSFILKHDTIKKEKLSAQLSEIVETNFNDYTTLVIKNAGMDGNGNGVGFIHKSDKLPLLEQINVCLQKFTERAGKKPNKVYENDYLIQNFIENKIGEGSITFSIQNKDIECWGLANNIVNDSEYFLSTNHHPYLTDIEQIRITDQLSKDLLPVLEQLQKEGIRGNVGFDLIYQRNSSHAHVHIIESNGIHRTTGSTLPNSFAYNTGNKLFIGIPLSGKYLADSYNSFDKESLTALSLLLEGAGTELGKPQIMNMRYEGITSGYPVVWIASSGTTIDELYNLYIGLGFLNTLGEKYVKDLFTNIV